MRFRRAAASAWCRPRIGWTARLLEVGARAEGVKRTASGRRRGQSSANHCEPLAWLLRATVTSAAPSRRKKGLPGRGVRFECGWLCRPGEGNRPSQGEESSQGAHLVSFGGSMPPASLIYDPTSRKLQGGCSSWRSAARATHAEGRAATSAELAPARRTARAPERGFDAGMASISA
jgi:hypothetical protein